VQEDKSLPVVQDMSKPLARRGCLIYYRKAIDQAVVARAKLENQELN
jgi:hypothetical protein